MLRNIGIVLLLLFLIGCGPEAKKFDEQYYSCTNSCEGEYYLREAENTTSVELCSKIDDGLIRVRCEDSLYYMMAVRDKKISLCLNINNELSKERCAKELVLDDAMEQKNPEICNKLEDGSECKDTVRMNLAIAGNDLALCEQIVEKSLRDSCISLVKGKISGEAAAAVKESAGGEVFADTESPIKVGKVSDIDLGTIQPPAASGKGTVG